MPRLQTLLLAALAMLIASGFSIAAAQETVAKEVTLIINGKRLVASNVRLSRFDELQLNAQEKILKKAESKGVIVIVTNQRIIGYGVSSGWRDLKTQAGEKIKSIRTEDYAGFVVSDERYLNFNGETGIWAERDRRTER